MTIKQQVSWRRACFVGVLGSALAITACSSSSKTTGAGTTKSSSSTMTSSSASTSTSGSTSGTDSGKITDATFSQARGFDAAVAANKAAIQGSFQPVDSTSRPGPKGKKIVIISAGQAGETNKGPVDAAANAARALGWKVTVYDGKLNPSTYPALVNQAVAAGVDGILLEAIDCRAAKSALELAKAKKIKLVHMLGYDCNQGAGADTNSPGVFDAGLNFGIPDSDVGVNVASGAVQANYIISTSQNKAKVIDVFDPEFVGLNDFNRGFVDGIEGSGGSKIVDKVSITVADLIGGKLPAIIQAAVLRNPTATWIRSPYGDATLAGIVPGLGANTHHISVMGAEGSAAELDLIRKGVLTAAVNASFEWYGWAGIDTLNSLFIGQKPVVSGVGMVLIDKDHNLPASGTYQPKIDFKSQYKAAWGVS